jgi:hypothetical protein
VKEVFLFSKTLVPALGPTQLLIQLVLGSFLGVKLLGHGADQSPLSGSEVKKEWSYASTPFLYVFMTWTGTNVNLPFKD